VLAQRGWRQPHRRRRFRKSVGRPHGRHPARHVHGRQPDPFGEGKGLLDVVDRACRHARRTKPFHPLGDGARGQARAQLGLQRTAMGAARVVGGEALVVDKARCVEGGAQRAEDRVVAAGDHQLAVGRRERLVGRDRRMTVA